MINGILFVYLERDDFNSLDNKIIIQHFKDVKIHQERCVVCDELISNYFIVVRIRPLREIYGFVILSFYYFVDFGLYWFVIFIHFCMLEFNSHYKLD